MRRIDARMAQEAWVATAEAKNAKVLAEFRSRANALPAMLQTAGLAAAMAFLASKKGEPACGRLGKDLARRLHAAVEELPADPIELVRHLHRLSAADYARATVEARMYAAWLHRAVEALREDEPRKASVAPKKEEHQ